MRRCSVKCEVCIWQCAVCSVKLLACSSHHVEVIDATWTQPGTSEVGTLGKELFFTFYKESRLLSPIGASINAILNDIVDEFRFS